MDKETNPPAKPSPASDPGYVNAMCHFYRGELGRIMAWRQRLDTTTTWAITTTTTISTLAFSLREVPHFIFFFNMVIISIMLWIEARRYRFYDAFRARVRLLEAHFFVSVIMQRTNFLQGNWKSLLSEDLILPTFKMSIMEAIGLRLHHNYIFLFIIIQGAWLAKIFLHARQPIESVGDFYRALATGQIPPWAVATVLAGSFMAVLGVSIYIALKKTEEFTEFGRPKAQWRI